MNIPTLPIDNFIIWLSQIEKHIEYLDAHSNPRKQERMISVNVTALLEDKTVTKINEQGRVPLFNLYRKLVDGEPTRDIQMTFDTDNLTTQEQQYMHKATTAIDCIYRTAEMLDKDTPLSVIVLMGLGIYNKWN